MFICYPTDTKLAELVPNSKWVRVTSEDDYYVVGLIFELDEPKFICYGIHGYFTVKPDADLTAISEWLPIDYDNAEGEGYWMIYQSATDGKTLKKIIKYIKTHLKLQYCNIKCVYCYINET
jgi:hypothetical protein